MIRYALLQITEIDSKIPIIKTDIFRYGIRNLESKFINKPLKDLIFQLTQNTKYLISMDLSVLFEYYKLTSHEKSFNLRYDKGTSHTKVTSRDLTTLLAYPEESLEKVGINSKNIEIKKRKFPSGVKMSNYEINPFPILIIENKNYPEKWIEYFNKIINDEDQVPKIFFEDIWRAKEVDNGVDDWLNPSEWDSDDPPF